MLNKSYFQNRLNDIYQYSLIDYLYGEAIIDSGKTKTNVNWELCVDVSGNVIFVVSDFPNNLDLNEQYSVSGISNDKIWLLKGNNICFNFKTCGTEETIAFGIIESIELIKNSFEISNIEIIEVYLINFDFVPGKFTCKANNKDISFHLIDMSEKIKEFLYTKRINSAILSKLILVKENETFEQILDLAYDITCFLGLINLNYCFDSLIEGYSEKQLIYMKINNPEESKYSIGKLIDNFHKIKDGITSIFSDSFINYLTLNSQINFKIVIDFLIKMEHEPTIEIKFSLLIR